MSALGTGIDINILRCITGIYAVLNFINEASAAAFQTFPTDAEI